MNALRQKVWRVGRWQQQEEWKSSNTLRIGITLKPLSFYCTTIKRCFLKSSKHNHVPSEVNLWCLRACGARDIAGYTNDMRINITFAGNNIQTFFLFFLALALSTQNAKRKMKSPPFQNRLKTFREKFSSRRRRKKSGKKLC